MNTKIKLVVLGSVAALLIAAPVLAQGDSPTPTPAADPDGVAPISAPSTTTTAEPTAPPAPKPSAQPTDATPAAAAPDSAPAVTLGTGSDLTKKDEATKDDKKDEEKKEPATPIAGTSFFFQTGVSPNVFSPGMVQSPDVTVDSFALFQPRWRFNKFLQLRGRFAFNYEWTDNVNSSTTRKREPRFTDSIVSLAVGGIPDLAKIKTLVLLNLGIPTSPESQARTMYVSPGVGVSFARAFEHVLGGSVALGLSVSYSHPFYHYTTAGTENPTPYQFSCFNAGGDASCNGQVSATANTANSVVALANIGGEWGRFEPSVFFLLSNGWAYTFQNQPGVARLPDSTHFRQATFFGAELDYKLTGWLSAGVGYQMFRASILDNDGKIGNPFYSIYQDSMRIYLGTSIDIDKLYLGLSGQSEKKTANAPKQPYFSGF